MQLPGCGVGVLLRNDRRQARRERSRERPTTSFQSRPLLHVLHVLSILSSSSSCSRPGRYCTRCATTVAPLAPSSASRRPSGRCLVFDHPSHALIESPSRSRPARSLIAALSLCLTALRWPSQSTSQSVHRRIRRPADSPIRQTVNKQPSTSLPLSSTIPHGDLHPHHHLTLSRPPGSQPVDSIRPFVLACTVPSD